MKTFTMCSVCGALAFLVLGYPLGLYDGMEEYEEEEQPAPAVKPKKPAGPTAAFPDALAAACAGRPVPEAAAYDGNSSKAHPLVFLFETGKLHHDWQEIVPDDWQATSVSQTELVVVVGPDKETFLGRTLYQRGAPPIDRYKYELEIRVVAAKSGKVVGRNRFVAMPRLARPVEAWEFTKLGRPVSFNTVYAWVTASASAGFPLPRFGRTDFVGN